LGKIKTVSLNDIMKDIIEKRTDGKTDV